MMKCNSGLVAREFAIERKEHYGASVFSPGWYVGTREELSRIGVIDIDPDPTPAKKRRCRKAA